MSQMEGGSYPDWIEGACSSLAAKYSRRHGPERVSSFALYNFLQTEGADATFRTAAELATTGEGDINWRQRADELLRDEELCAEILSIKYSGGAEAIG